MGKIIRAVKVVSVLKAFTEIRILLRTLLMSGGSLAWSMCLVATIVTASGIFMTQLTLGFIEGEDNDIDMRHWVYEKFGSAGRSAFTMFEVTFTSGWAQTARPMMED